ncbi:signal peptidase II [Massilia sp. TS11]|uniref:signal peptidase II n=1 Tax=Massilia sp. TS11 TaxID=2908003 RepID=UPI001EDB3D5F|nr:signal peptidase II [Massilia sp. TS11]MCG2582792.1 signal peptidase II [Massilia sp. TS11]
MAQAKKPAGKPSFSAVPAGPRGTLAPWLGVIAIVILCDQLSKIVITKLFQLYETRVVTSFFNLVFVYNPGAAFSFLHDAGGWQRYFFTALGIGAAAYIIYLLKRHAGQRMFCWALALIAGGAIGNVIDRLIYGKVVDFLDFHHETLGHFPAFNIADTAITIGAILFIIDELRRVNKH